MPAVERIAVGLIGVGCMGMGHLHRLAGDPGVQLTAVCDVDRTRLNQARSTVESIYASQAPSGTFRGCTAFNDYREMLERPELDAVLIATPDHWHAQQSIDAARAGKDIYCEKPVSVTLQEGRRIVDAVQRYGRVYQTGTQYRSIPTIRQVCQFVREGGLGKVKAVFTQLQTLGGWLHGERFKPFAGVVSPDRFGGSFVPLDFALPPDPVPEGLDWDLWVGPAPWRPYNRLYHINPSPGVVPWSFCDAFGVTSTTWFLSHATDVIQYALGMENYGPVDLIHPSTGEFPTLTFRYDNGVLLHFVDDWRVVKETYKAVPADARLAGMFGGVFVGERGWVTALSTGGPVEAGPESLLADMKLGTREVNIGANNHHANWLESVRKRQKTSADEEIGHRAASVGHLTNIVLRSGRSLSWDPAKETFAGCDAANQIRSRASRPPWRS